MNFRRFVLCSIVAIVALFPVSYALAQAGGEPSGGDLARALLDAIQGGRYFEVLAVSVSLIALIGRHLVGGTGVAGVLLVALQALGASLTAAAVAGQSFSWELLGASLRVFFYAAGGYSLIQFLVRKTRGWFERKTSGWVRDLLVRIFDYVDPPKPAPAAAA